MLKNIKTGIIYKNASPHLKSNQAYFPSVTVASNGDIIATAVLGEAFESVDLQTCLFRSKDNGETWVDEGPIYQKERERMTSDVARLAKLPDGDLIINMLRCDRSNHPDKGLSNPDTFGFVQTEFVTFRSSDFGYSWKGPNIIDSPIGDTPIEMCCPIIPIKNGSCLIPTSTWKKWDGSSSMGPNMIAFVSHDNAKSWPEYVNVMADSNQEINYWESKIVELSENQLVAVAWAYNEVTKEDLPNQYALSSNGGKSWSAPKSTNILGQTLTPFLLNDGRILNVYRRVDKPGLWVTISRIENDQWINESTEPLWDQRVSGLTEYGENMVENFNVLKFGAPSIIRLPDAKIFIAFWCVENCISVIRWFKIKEENL